MSLSTQASAAEMRWFGGSNNDLFREAEEDAVATKASALMNLDTDDENEGDDDIRDEESGNEDEGDDDLEFEDDASSFHSSLSSLSENAYLLQPFQRH